MISPDLVNEEVQAIKKELLKRPKPWSHRLAPKVYNWKSSLNDSWVKLYGPKCFKKALNNDALRLNGHNLNNSKEFLHSLKKIKMKIVNEEDDRDQIISCKRIRLNQISHGIDLIGQNEYIRQKMSRTRTRSQNSTPIKRK